MKIIFTNLDGSLLDSDTYSFQSAQKTVAKLKEKDIPISICSSKTRAEIEFWRKKLKNHHPFISENGGGIFIPKNYFPFKILYQKETKNYYIIQLGSKKEIVQSVMENLTKHFQIKSFLDMSEEEIAEDANLPLFQAKLAKQREYSVPFKILNKNEFEDILNEIERHNLRYTIGKRYFHLISNTTKGEATKTLIYLYSKKYKDIFTLGIGKSENDFPMLDAVDKPYLVKKNNDSFASEKYNLAEKIGPEGWTQIVKKELKI